MSHSKSLFASCTLVLSLFLFNSSVGKDPIKGNGHLVTKKLALAPFHSVSIETFFNVDITCGKMPMAEVTIDENILKHLQIEVKAGVLTVNVDQWVEATQSKLQLQIPFLTDFAISGWGTVNITHLKSARFNLKAGTGRVKVQGTALRSRVLSNTGGIDLSELDTRVMEIQKNGYGDLRVKVDDTLIIKGGAGKVVYNGSPIIVNASGAEGSDGVITISAEKERQLSKKALVYVRLKIKNNSKTKQDFVIKGPREDSFSYGFQIPARSYREERVPQGTKIWLECNSGISGPLLLEVSAADEGKTIDLF